MAIHLSQSIKEGNKAREQAYKETEARISAFRMAQIVRERENLTDAPEEIYEEALKKILSFWEKLTKKESLDFSPLKNIVDSFRKSLKNSEAILINLTRSCPPENYLPYHSLNVCLISIALGLGLNWNSKRLQDLGLAALLHDIGMSQISGEIYLKSGSLGGNERAKINEHPKAGLEMLEKEKGFSENIIQIVFQHHERSNGRGYPQKLRGSDIHPGATIVGLADTFEAITHPRLYHKERLPYEALTELISEKVRDFDKNILKSLIEELTFYPPGTFVELNTGEVAVVEHTSSKYPTRPKVRVFISEGGEKLEPPREVNLPRERLLYIQRPIFAPAEQRKTG
ncbi:MAG: HD domain-containing protein [Candidatus Ratteibacteria bacterium]|nr:HD domain-containing protein [Candidatus Ratteibacteria bacterium]